MDIEKVLRNWEPPIDDTLEASRKTLALYMKVQHTPPKGKVDLLESATRQFRSQVDALGITDTIRKELTRKPLKFYSGFKACRVIEKRIRKNLDQIFKQRDDVLLSEFLTGAYIEATAADIVRKNPRLTQAILEDLVLEESEEGMTDAEAIALALRYRLYP